MIIFVSGQDLNFDYDLHSLATSFSGDPDVRIVYHESDGAGQTVGQVGQMADRDDDAQTAGSMAGSSAGQAAGREEDAPLYVNYGRTKITVSCGSDTVSFDIDPSDRRIVKNALKKAVYNVLSHRFDRKLPWGTMSGVRPVKVPMKLLKGGAADDEVIRTMKSTYLVREDKAALALEVAKKERKVLAPVDLGGYSLYAGIPFCPTTCAYCSFTSYPVSAYKDRIDDYISALIRELKAIASIMEGRTLQTVYIGGGTPTSLEEEQLHRLMSAIDEIFGTCGLLEYTVEAGRPDSITEGKLDVIKEHGAGRISVNPQTMNQSTLDLIGRRHTAEDAVRSFELARACGFSDINMDFILGLPGETIDELAYSMERAKELAPDSLTFHSLAVKRAGKIRTIMRDGAQDDRERRLLASEITDDHIRLAADTAGSLGMEPYYLYRQQSMTGSFENTGYAVPGKEGIYNIIMMEEVSPVMAAGAGATSKLLVPPSSKKNNPFLKDIERVENVKNVDEYIARVDGMIDRKKKKAEEVYGS